MHWPCNHTRFRFAPYLVRGINATCLAVCGSSHSSEWKVLANSWPLKFVSPPEYSVHIDRLYTLGTLPRSHRLLTYIPVCIHRNHSITDRNKCKSLCEYMHLCTPLVTHKDRHLSHTTHCRETVYANTHTYAQIPSQIVHLHTLYIQCCPKGPCGPGQRFRSLLMLAR